MKKTILVTLAGLMLSASVAMAAAPAAPVYGPMSVSFSKVGEGKLRQPGGRSFAVDGNNIYAAVAITTAPDFIANFPAIITSTDGGLTWGMTKVIGPETSYFTVRVAIGADPLASGKKIVHATWGSPDETTLYYSYSHAGLNDWTTPVVVPGVTGSSSSNIAASSTGEVHVISDGLYVYASAPGAQFSYPAPYGANGDATIQLDANRNVYVAAGGQIFKKPASSSTWTSSTFTTNINASDPSLVVANANTYYIAYIIVGTNAAGLGTNQAAFAYTTNGGTTWTNRTVGTPQAGAVWPALASYTSGTTTTHTLVTEQFDAAGNILKAKVFRSNDNFATSSSMILAKGQHRSSIAVDSTGKTMLMTRDQVVDGNSNNANILFTREK